MMLKRSPVSAAVLLLTLSLLCTATGASEPGGTGFIVVGNVPVCQFDASYGYTAIPMQVRFLDHSQGTAPLSYAWNFGDGGTSADQNPAHTYTAEGTYTVTLTVNNSIGSDMCMKKDLIRAGSGPVADFSADRTTVGTGRVVSFRDLSTVSPTGWVWDFGDGTTGAGRNPDHRYSAAGVYTVTLTVSNADMTASRTRTGYITVVEIPRADFSADRASGIAPVNVSFTDRSSGAPTAWKWDFGDGSASSEQNPVHRYQVPGNYTVSLFVSNDNGGDTAARSNFITANAALKADFRADRQEGKAPFIVRFTDLSTGGPTSWSWDFGDGSVSHEQNPAHIYLKEGSYNVRLTVANAFGSDTVVRSGSPSVTIVTMTPSTTSQYALPATEEPVTTRTTRTRAEPTKSPVPVGLPMLAVGGVLVLVARARRV